MNELDSPKRAALYIRVSSEEQAMHGKSLPAQKADLEEYATKHGYKVIGLYADEGVTARKKYKNRDGFMRMLRDVQQDKIDIILFIRLDRWFRNVADYYEVQRVLDAHNVQWATTQERYDTTTANGRLNLNIKLSIAQDESDRTSERIRFVFQDKVRRGEVISGKVPFGYKIENKRMAPDPERAEIAKDIFHHYLGCKSIRATRKYVLDQYGMVYSPTGLRMFLTNERYMGRAFGNPEFCEPLIPREQFLLVQKMIQERAQRCSTTYPDRIYLFAGLAFCTECGNRLSGHVVAGKYIYYRCTKYDKLHLCTHKRSTSELVLEDWLLHNLPSQFEQYNAMIRQGRENGKPKDLDKIKRKMRKLQELYLNDLIDLEEYEPQYRALKIELETGDQDAIELAPVDVSAFQNLDQVYWKLDRGEKREFWVRTVGKIMIDTQENISVFPAQCLLNYK